MDERQKRDRGNTYVPPTPEHVKPKASRDNSVEMAAGGEHERKAMDAQREKMDDPGRTDNPRGTGVGYGGAGSALYGNEEEGTGGVRRQEEMRHEQQTPPHKPGGSGGGTGAQQSTGSPPPRQGAGSAPESRTAPTPTPNRNEQPGNSTRATHSSGGAASQGLGATAQGTTVNMEVASQSAATDAKVHAPGNMAGGAEGAQAKITDIRDQTQGKLSDAKEQVQSKLDDVKGQAQGKFDDARAQAQDKVAEIRTQGQEKVDAVTGQAQDTLEGVRATLQTKSDQLKETMSGKTDQFVGTVTEKGGQVKQAATEKSAQAGERLTGLADTLREKTQTLEPDHPVANVATKAAGALEQTGTYLQEHTPDDWVGDLKRLIARKPIESVCVAAGLGYMAARASRK